MLTSVELFAGAGGLALGLSMAGFRPLAVVERDRFACDTIRRNRNWPLYQGDARTFDYESVPGSVDLVAGGPPCQPFSLGGRHKGHHDARDMFPVIAEAVRRLRPRAFILENVKGLTRPGFASYLAYILARLALPEIDRGPDETWVDHARRLQRSRSGLTYRVSFQILNAADFGVPQRRERVFIVGFRNDLPDVEWRFPKPTHSLAALLADQSRGGPYWDRHHVLDPRSGQKSSPSNRPECLLPWRTVRDALAGLPDPELDVGAACSIADHRFQAGVRFYPGHSGSVLDRPAKTLKAGDHGVPGGENALVREDGSGRYFTVRESARLQTFPDDYVFGGSWSEAMRQLGNAVPVTLAGVMGQAVARTLTMRDALSRVP